MNPPLEAYIARIDRLMGVQHYNGLKDVYDRLVRLYRRRGLARYHALLQYIMASKLYTEGYDVEVERAVGGGYRADVYGEAPWGTIVIEVETGFIPPGVLLEASSYLQARIIYKAAMYSGAADRFGLAVPYSMNVEDIAPPWLFKDPDSRLVEYREVLSLVSRYFNGPIGVEDLEGARIDIVYLIRLSSSGVELLEYRGGSSIPGRVYIWI